MEQNVQATRVRNWIRATALVCATGALMTTTACSSDNGTQPEGKSPETTTSAPEPTVTTSADPTEQAKKEAIQIYKDYWTEMERAYASGTTKGTDLPKYAAGLALSVANKDVASQHKAGQMAIGDVTVEDSVVTAIDLHRKVPNASLSSCLDISKWEVVDRETKKKADLPEGRLMKYVIRTTLERWPEGWRVVKDEPQERAC